MAQHLIRHGQSCRRKANGNGKSRKLDEDLNQYGSWFSASDLPAGRLMQPAAEGEDIEDWQTEALAQS